MSENQPLHFLLGRSQFYEIGRALKHNWHTTDLRPLIFAIEGGKLSITSKSGGSETPCRGGGHVAVQVSLA